MMDGESPVIDPKHTDVLRKFADSNSRAAEAPGEIGCIPTLDIAQNAILTPWGENPALGAQFTANFPRIMLIVVALLAANGKRAKIGVWIST
jgi:hypothetical protein